MLIPEAYNLEMAYIPEVVWWLVPKANQQKPI